MDLSWVELFTRPFLPLPLSPDPYRQGLEITLLLARDSEAKSTRPMHVIVQIITCIVGKERSDHSEFMRRMCFSPFKPYLHLRETLLNNIYAVEMQP